MPYTLAQCRKFAVMAANGEKPPADWKEHCRKYTKSDKERKKREARKKSSKN